MLFKQKEQDKCYKKIQKVRGVDSSQKATSTPLNPKSKMQNQGEEVGYKNNTLYFLVKREESRGFNVFFMFGREEKCVEDEGRTQELWRPLFVFFFFFWSEGCLGPFITRHDFQGDNPSRAATFKRPWIGLILTFLERF